MSLPYLRTARALRRLRSSKRGRPVANSVRPFAHRHESVTLPRARHPRHWGAQGVVALREQGLRALKRLSAPYITAGHALALALHSPSPTPPPLSARVPPPILSRRSPQDDPPTTSHRLQTPVSSVFPVPARCLFGLFICTPAFPCTGADPGRRLKLALREREGQKLPLKILAGAPRARVL